MFKRGVITLILLLSASMLGVNHEKSKAGAVFFPNWCQSTDGSFVTTEQNSPVYYACGDIDADSKDWANPTSVMVRDKIGNPTEGYIVHAPDGSSPGPFSSWHRPGFVAEFDKTKTAYWPFAGTGYNSVTIRDNFLPYGQTTSVYVWTYSATCLDASSTGPDGKRMYGPKEMALFGPYTIRSGKIGGVSVYNIIHLDHHICFNIDAGNDTNSYSYSPLYGWNCPQSMCGRWGTQEKLAAKHQYTSCRYVPEFCEAYVSELSKLEWHWPFQDYLKNDRDMDGIPDKYDIDGGLVFNLTGYNKAKDPNGKHCKFCSYQGIKPGSSGTTVNSTRVTGARRLIRSPRSQRVSMVTKMRVVYKKKLVKNRRFCVQTSRTLRGKYKTVMCAKQKQAWVQASKAVSKKKYTRFQCRKLARQHAYTRIVFTKTKKAPAIILRVKTMAPKC